MSYEVDVLLITLNLNVIKLKLVLHQNSIIYSHKFKYHTIINFVNAAPVLVLLTDSELHFFTKSISWIFWVFQALTHLLFLPLLIL